MNISNNKYSCPENKDFSYFTVVIKTRGMEQRTPVIVANNMSIKGTAV